MLYEFRPVIFGEIGVDDPVDNGMFAINFSGLSFFVGGILGKLYPSRSQIAPL
jgi:hypothetical protein